VNRPLEGAAALLLAMLAASPVRAQTPLVVGSVRDQHGMVIVGAIVTGRTAEGPLVSAVTDAAGTFALHGAGIMTVRIECRYCASTQTAVVADRPVVAIVRRYTALTSDAPSSADLQNLPYAHIESSIALRPFTLLAQETASYPGPTLNDRGLSSSAELRHRRRPVALYVHSRAIRAKRHG
jgi:hypothetical protein